MLNVRLDPLAAFSVAGRVALVTGARREIGRAIALALAAQGAKVIVHHAGGEEEARDAAEVVAAIGSDQSRAVAADFSREGEAARLAEVAGTIFGAVDILVLNASIEILEDYRAISRATFDRQIAVNLASTLDLLQKLTPSMAERRWGRVLTIGSIQQDLPHPMMLVYAGAKAAQLNWVLNLARQLGPSGVTVNNLAPGAILTARNRTQLRTDGEAYISRTPLGRVGAPDDLVGAALLLCSDAGRYITGVNLFVDGGRSIA